MAYDITVEEIASRLGKAKPTGDGSWYCRCPCHDDGKPSLWIAQRAGGGLNVKCHAGCASDNVSHALRSMGLWPKPGARKREKSDEAKRHRDDAEIAEIMATIPRNAPEIRWDQFRRPPPTQLYEYRNAGGDLTGYVARWDKTTGEKEIRPVSLAKLKNGKLAWFLKASPGPHHLYNLPELAARPHSPVLILEGEKAAIAASRLFPEHVCMAWRSGASAAGKSDFSPLRDRAVTLWPDSDDAGFRAMDEVRTILATLGITDIRIVHPPSQVEKGWDVADPTPDGVSLEELLRNASPVGLALVADEIEHASDVPAELPSRTALLPFVVSASDLDKVEVEFREPIIEPFLLTSSLNMLFAPRGVGKTFLSLALATSLALGTNFLAYDVSRKWRTLYFDGEMPLADLKQRIGQLSPVPPEGFEIIPSESLFRDGVPINLHDEADQQRIFILLRELEVLDRRPDLLIFDNLSSLSGGVNENDNSELDKLLRFLMALRHFGYAVLLIHHAGKGGDQRGASRREDLLDTVMSLQKPPDTASQREGAHGLLTFSKVRGKQPSPDELEIWLMEIDGRLEWAFQKPKTKNPAMGALRAIVEHAPKSQAELARILGVSDGRVSQILKKLREADLVDGRELALTAEGRERIVDHFPELFAQLAQQNHMFRDDGII